MAGDLTVAKTRIEKLQDQIRALNTTPMMFDPIQKRTVLGSSGGQIISGSAS